MLNLKVILKRKRVILIIVLISITLFSVRAQEKFEPSFIKDSLDNYIKKGLMEWNVPGLGIIIVKNGQVIKNQSYGFSNLEAKTMIDSSTLFPLASITKHITALALVKELYKQEITLETPFVNFLKDYNFYNNELSNNYNFRDLLSHQLGFQNHEGDFYLFESDYTKKEIINKVWQTKNTFSKSWGYHNTGYVIAGNILERLSNTSYENYLNNSFFDELGMHETYSSFNKIENNPQKITPYFDVNEELIKVEYPNTDKYQAAGGIHSTLNDMGKWLMFLLNPDKFSSNSINSTIINELQKPLIEIQKGYHPYYKIESNVEYGLGLRIRKYYNKKLVYHSGGLPGITTLLFLLPKNNLGAFIVCNKHSTGLPTVLMYEILDSYIGLCYKDYSSLFKKQYQDYYENKYYNYAKAIVVNSSPLKKRIFNLLGQYYNSEYGYISLVIENNNLKILFEHHPTLIGDLVSFENNDLEFNLLSYFFNKVKVELNDDKSLNVTFPNSDPHIYKFNSIKK